MVEEAVEEEGVVEVVVQVESVSLLGCFEGVWVRTTENCRGTNQVYLAEE